VSVRNISVEGVAIRCVISDINCRTFRFGVHARLAGEFHATAIMNR